MADLIDTDANESVPLPFQPLGRYSYPSKPAKETLREFYERAIKRFRQIEDAPFISRDQMRSASGDVLDAVTLSNHTSWLRRELDLTLKDFVERKVERDRLRVIVLPPSGQRRLLRDWSKDNDCVLLEPPKRSALLKPPAKTFALPKTKKGQILVIPQLERWYLRHLDGLRHIEALLRSIENSDTPIIVGCNSWAWAYLSKAVEADTVLPRPKMFQAFNAERLKDWLRDLAANDGEDAVTIRFSGSGAKVFLQEEKESSEEQSTFFKNLAAASFGIPFVAWHMWRASLLTSGEKNEENPEKNEKLAAPDDGNTLWVSSFPEFKLPYGHNDKTLLILHSLLLHEDLTLEELAQVLPMSGYSSQLFSLQEAGLVRQSDSGAWTCRTIAYPFIYDSLANAGLPTDKL